MPPAAVLDSPPLAPAVSVGDADLGRVQATLDAALDAVRKGTRARFAAARLAGVDGGVVRFAVPNEPTRVGCEKHADEVAVALSDRLGEPVRVVVVVDDAGARAERGARPATPPPHEPEEPVDPGELIDAPDAGDGVVARLTSAFPGAELLEHD